MTETVKLEKLVHGGQAIGTLADGRRVFVWNALPGETVEVQLTKSKYKLAEGIAIKILEASKERITPKDDAYLSTSPWQIMSFDTENRYKQEILAETFQREHVKFDREIKIRTFGDEWHYRNKMEYSFWADDNGLHLALFNRGTHHKQIVTGSSIAMHSVDMTANKILSILNKHGVRGSQLKTLIVRSNQKNETVAALFVKDQAFPALTELSNVCSGIAIYYSNPKSPASVITKELQKYGDIILTDSIMGSVMHYDVNSFFQVNVTVFELAAKRIDYLTGGAGEKVDMYAGVGTLGIPSNATKLVEIDAHNIEMMKQNIAWPGRMEIVHASAETALEHIPFKGSLIVDPPRAGLHTKVIERIRDAKPGSVTYLSCNPITQARDIALLQDIYEIQILEGYNFFPKTPHIESLVHLSLKAR